MSTSKRLQGECMRFEVDIGQVIEPLYSPKTLVDLGFGFDEDVGVPGVYPFSRVHRATMFRAYALVVADYSKGPVFQLAGMH